MTCEWAVVDEPRCGEPGAVRVFGLDLCPAHAKRALDIRETVVSERIARDRRKPRRFVARA